MTTYFLVNLMKPTKKTNSSPLDWDLTDEQWQYIQHLFASPSRRGRPPDNPRLILAAIFWKCALNPPWSSLPAQYLPYKTCYTYYRKWLSSKLLHNVVFLLIQHLKEVGGFDVIQAVEQKEIDLVCRSGNWRLICPKELTGWRLKTALIIMSVVLCIRYG